MSDVKSLTLIDRVDLSVLLLLFLGLLVFQLDRMNLASALTDGFADDISVNQDTINLGNQLMFMGIVVFEIPCNMALQKVRFDTRQEKCNINLINKQLSPAWTKDMDCWASLHFRTRRNFASIRQK